MKWLIQDPKGLRVVKTSNIPQNMTSLLGKRPNFIEPEFIKKSKKGTGMKSKMSKKEGTLAKGVNSSSDSDFDNKKVKPSTQK